MAEIKETLSDKIIFGGLNQDAVNSNWWEEDFAVIRRRDIKQFIKNIKKSIDECADHIKTDIWDNERWEKFRKILRKEINNLAGDKLI